MMKKSVSVQCAESLFLQKEKCNSASEKVISSALAMMVDCARFLEEHARNDPSLGIISIAILAKTSVAHPSDAKLFTLWGPKLPPGINQLSDGDSVDKDFDELGEGLADSIEGRPSRNRGQGQQSYPEEGGTVDPCQHSPHESRNASLPGGKSTTGNGPENSVEDYVEPIDIALMIPDSVTAKCLSFLMDAGGITSHTSTCNYGSLSNIPASFLIKVVRSVMDAFKEKNELKSKFVKYSSLLPRELRGRHVQFNAMKLIRNKQGYSVLNSNQSVQLSVKKPDRNKKELQFAMLAALLHVDFDGVCCEELKKLSVEGLSDCGCVNKPGSPCNGPEQCRERQVESVCDFYNENDTVVGSGQVYPSVSFL